MRSGKRLHAVPSLEWQSQATHRSPLARHDLHQAKHSARRSPQIHRHTHRSSCRRRRPHIRSDVLEEPLRLDVGESHLAVCQLLQHTPKRSRRGRFVAFFQAQPSTPPPAVVDRSVVWRLAGAPFRFRNESFSFPRAPSREPARIIPRHCTNFAELVQAVTVGRRAAATRESDVSRGPATLARLSGFSIRLHRQIRRAHRNHLAGWENRRSACSLFFLPSHFAASLLLSAIAKYDQPHQLDPRLDPRYQRWQEQAAPQESGRWSVPTSGPSSPPAGASPARYSASRLTEAAPMHHSCRHDGVPDAASACPQGWLQGHDRPGTPHRLLQGEPPRSSSASRGSSLTWRDPPTASHPGDEDRPGFDRRHLGR